MALMRRQSLVKFDAPLCETIIETPKPQGREVLVRIERCGLCHSDLHIQDGYADIGGGKKLDTTRGTTLPFTLGHEIAGIVEEIGPDVAKDMIGARKAVFPWIGCGQCRDCQSGDENLCTRPRFLGVSLDGGFASHVLVPHPRYLLDYAPLAAAFAGPLMCSGLTAYAALARVRLFAAGEADSAMEFPTPATLAMAPDKVYVGRLRTDLTRDRALNFWVVADNVRKCAAHNAVSVAHILVNRPQ